MPNTSTNLQSKLSLVQENVLYGSRELELPFSLKVSSADFLQQAFDATFKG
jgi:hypothetical protein